MTFYATKPAGSTKVRMADDEIRANFAALLDALARNHTFPGTEGGTAGEHSAFELRDQAGDLAQEAGLLKIWNNAGALKFVVPGGTARYLDAVPKDAIMLFGAAAAPTGWTKKTDWTNGSALHYTTGTPAAGGDSDPASIAPVAQNESSHVHAGPSHTHDLSSHTHAGVDHLHSVPNHQHTGTTGNDQEVGGNRHSTGSNIYITHNHAFTTDSSGACTSGAADRSLTTGGPSNNTSGAAGTGNTGAGGAHTHTIAAITPRYQQVIAAVRA